MVSDFSCRTKTVGILERGRIAYFGCDMEAVGNVETPLDTIIESERIASGITIVNQSDTDKGNNIPPTFLIALSYRRHQVYKEVGMIMMVSLIRQSPAFPLETLKYETVSYRWRVPFA